MAALSWRGRVLARLLGLQAAWSYERMQGVGMGWAAEPALRAVFGRDDPRYRAALTRAAQFFNANPYLAAAAVGAEVRAEVDGVPGPQVERLRAALCGPLGALGDRLFWGGVVPALGAGAALAIALGAGPWAVLAAVAAHNAIRLALARWLLALGWQHGLRVGGAITDSRLPRLGEAAGWAAACLGMAVVPVVGVWLLRGVAGAAVVAVLGFVAGALMLRRLLGPRASARGLTVVGAAAALLWHLLNP